MSKLVTLLLASTVVILVIAALAYATNFTLNPTGPNFQNSATIVQELKQLQRLETAAFTMEKIIETSSNYSALRQLLFGDRLLLIAHGQVIAGVDLAELDEQDIKVQGEQIVVTLPPTQILVTSLDNQNTRVYDRRRGLLSKGSITLETQARQQAEAVITQAACEALILNKAAEQAQVQVTVLLKALGFSKVEVVASAGECEWEARAGSFLECLTKKLQNISLRVFNGSRVVLTVGRDRGWPNKLHPFLL